MLGTLSFALLLMVVPGWLHAGTVMEMEQTRPGHESESHKSYVDERGMRVDVSAKDSIIFRHDKKVIWVINRDKKTYTEITEAVLKDMTSKLVQAQAMMMKRFESMPAAQRKAMQNIIGNKLPLHAKEKVEYKKTESGVSCGQWTCDHYEGKRGTLKKGDVWVASADKLGIEATAYQSMRSFGDFTAKLTDHALHALGETSLSTLLGLGGFPVKQISYKASGEVDTEVNLKSVKTASIEPHFFDLPAGYTKTAFPTLK